MKITQDLVNKPVWLLDVDGVINACPWDGQFPATFPEDTWNLVAGVAMGQEWPIRYSSVVIDRINALSERAEIRWHTTWRHDAPPLGAQIGLNEFSVQETPYMDTEYGSWFNASPHNWWKMQAALDVISVEKRNVIWTDDDLDFEHSKLALDLSWTSDVRVCLITPSTYCGLTNEELDKIEEFIEQTEEINNAAQSVASRLQ